MQEMWEDICLEKGTKEYSIEKTILMQEMWETIFFEKGKTEYSIALNRTNARNGERICNGEKQNNA